MSVAKPCVVIPEETRFPACIGCGYCCMKVPCQLVEVVGGEWHGCPHLTFAQGRHWCRLVVHYQLNEGLQPGSQDVDVNAVLSIGDGCCSSMNSWRREPLQDRRKK